MSYTILGKCNITIFYDQSIYRHQISVSGSKKPQAKDTSRRYVFISLDGKCFLINCFS